MSYFECCRSTAILTDSPVRAALEEEQKKNDPEETARSKENAPHYRKHCTHSFPEQGWGMSCVWGNIQLILARGSVGAVSLLPALVTWSMHWGCRTLYVTTVTMSRQMPFVMFLFVCTVYLLTPVKISQVSIQMDLVLLLDSSRSHSVVSKFSTVFWEYAMVSQRLSLTFVSAATDTWCFLAVFVCFLDHILSWWMKKTIEWKKIFIKWIDIANKQI